MDNQGGRVLPLWDNGGMRKRRITETLTFTYTGEAFEDGVMNVADFGRALIGYNTMVDQIVKTVAPSASDTSISFTRTEKGSFQTIVTLTADETVWELAWRILTSDKTANLATTAGGIVLGGGAIKFLINKTVQFIKHRRGRAIEKVEDDGETKEITYSDGERVSVNVQVYDLAVNNQYLSGVKLVVAPLENEGADAVVFSGEDGESEVIESKDRAFFTPMEDVRDSVDVETAILRLRSVSFDQGAVWKFTRLYPPHEKRIEENLSARIEDKSFLAKVDNGFYSFTKGDSLVARLSIERPGEKSGRRPKFTIIEVVKVCHEQTLFDYEGLGEENQDV